MSQSEPELIDSLNDQIVNIDVRTLSKLTSLGVDCLGVFMFFIKTSKLQKTKQIFAINSFAQKGLGIGKDKYQRAIKKLEENGLITRIMAKNEKGQFNKSYIRLEYLIFNSTTCQSDQKPPAGFPPAGFPACRDQTTNAYQEKKNAYQEKKNAYQEKKNTLLDFSLFNKPVQWIMAEFVEHRREKKKPITARALRMLANQMEEYSDEECVEAVKKSIANDWQGVFFNEKKKKLTGDEFLIAEYYKLRFDKFADKYGYEEGHRIDGLVEDIELSKSPRHYD